jgi:excisionase family DNA binding protein
MEPHLLPIGEAARRLGVSIDTLRRWDESGKLTATRKSPGGTRYYSEKSLTIYLHAIFPMAWEWATSPTPTDVPSPFYSSDSSIFQARLIKMQGQLATTPSAATILSLLVAITGEIGNNSFDHNIGNWPDKPGIFYGYDANKGEIVLADRGLGILKTLQRVRPALRNDDEALGVAFTEMVSGRAPEERGNGLKFVRKVISENPISLQFQTGDAELIIPRESSSLNITKVEQSVRGCIALIKF